MLQCQEFYTGCVPAGFRPEVGKVINLIKESGMQKFKLEPSQDAEGSPVLMYGFSFAGFWITDARISECGRFQVNPEYYQLSEAEAQELDRLNQDFKSR